VRETGFKFWVFKCNLYRYTEDRLHFRTAAWGGTMATKGRLLLLQTRFGFRREWRMVGKYL
jgi:hypothetical protein